MQNIQEILEYAASLEYKHKRSVSALEHSDVINLVIGMRDNTAIINGQILGTRYDKQIHLAAEAKVAPDYLSKNYKGILDLFYQKFMRDFQARIESMARSAYSNPSKVIYDKDNLKIIMHHKRDCIAYEQLASLWHNCLNFNDFKDDIVLEVYHNECKMLIIEYMYCGDDTEGKMKFISNCLNVNEQENYYGPGNKILSENKWFKKSSENQKEFLNKLMDCYEEMNEGVAERLKTIKSI